MALELRCVATNGPQRTVPFRGERLTIGSLPSNAVTIQGEGIEPLHCLLEQGADGTCRIIDLGTRQGVRVNGHRIDVEAVVVAGDKIEIGGTRLLLRHRPANATVTKITATAPAGLFRPMKTPGRYLEVVAYWGDTVLNVDHFHPSLRGMGDVTIGDPSKAHFIAGGREIFQSRVLAEVADDGCVLRLGDEMQARVRKDGHLRLLTGNERLTLGPNDYAHVAYGAVRYFLHFAEPPTVQLPSLTRRDQLFASLLGGGFALYLALVATALLTTPKPLPVTKESPWQTVHLTPETRKHAEMIVTEIEPSRPATPTAPAKTKVAPVTPRVTKTRVKEALAAPTPATAPTTNAGTQKGAARPGAGAPGAPGVNSAAVGTGPLKGSQSTSRPGVENGTRPTPSFTSLKELGGGLGPVLTRPGGIQVGARSTPGGQGLQQGSGLKNYGLDNAGGGTQLKVPGSSDRIGTWGDGRGFLGSDPSRPGSGIKGRGIGRFGHEPGMTVFVPPQDIVSASPESAEDIRQVISQHLNEIRHCYENLLQRSPQTTGKLKVRFVLGLDGRVTSTTVADTNIADSMFRSCVTGKVQRWVFKPLRGTDPLTVTYPFVFTPL